MKNTKILSIAVCIVLVFSCKNNQEKASRIAENATTFSETEKSDPVIKKPAKNLSESFKKYWYNGTAEITTYELSQARYGQIRSGKAILIFVTEDFLPEKQVKADQQNANNIPVLKLNATKNFTTGIYPYSIMQSAFYPVADKQHAIKITGSMQEWCGQMYAQINNREKFDVMFHSYFEGEADQKYRLENAVLENEIWNKIRISPEDLPQGNLKIIPSLEFCFMKHKKNSGISCQSQIA